MITLRDRDMEEFYRVWEEIRLCYSLLRQGRARTVAVRGRDGKVTRYTKPRACPGDTVETMEGQCDGK